MLAANSAHHGKVTDALVLESKMMPVGAYVLTGHAVRLVEERAVQERMHRQCLRTQWLIAALTFVAALLTLA